MCPMSNDEKKGTTFWRTVPWVVLISYAIVQALYNTPAGRSLLGRNAAQPTPAANKPAVRQSPAMVPTPAPSTPPAAGATAETNESAPWAGYVADSHCHNDYFGLVVPIPANWVKEDPSQTHSRGLIAGKETSGESFDAKNPDFFALHASFPENRDNWMILPTLLVVAEKQDHLLPTSSSTAYLTDLLRASPQWGKGTGQPADVVKFGYLKGINYSETTKDGIVYTTHAVAICKGYRVEFTATAGDHETLSKMQDQILRKVTFKESVK